MDKWNIRRRITFLVHIAGPNSNTFIVTTGPINITIKLLLDYKLNYNITGQATGMILVTTCA